MLYHVPAYTNCSITKGFESSNDLLHAVIEPSKVCDVRVQYNNSLCLNMLKSDRINGFICFCI